MADAEVKIHVTPNTHNTTNALHEVEHALHALVSPISSLRDGFAGIAEVAGIAFAIDKLKEWVSEAAEAGEQAVNLGAALNISAEAANNLKGAFSIVGANAQTLERAFLQIGRASQEALKTPDSRQAFGFRALGIDAEAFRNILNGPDGVTKAIDLLAEKYQELKAAGGNVGVTGPLGDILGRFGFSELDKAIKNGKEGLDELKRKWAETGPPSNEGLEQLDNLAEKMHLLEGALKNLGDSIAAGLAAPLGDFLTWATEMVSKVTRLLNLLQGGAVPANAPSYREDLDKAHAEAPIPPRAGTTGYHANAADNFALFNYGNIKGGTAATPWASYSSPEAGIDAIKNLLLHYQEGGFNTLEKIIPRYAGKEDAERKGLVGKAAAYTGYPSGEALNLSDPAVMQKMLGAILTQEGAPGAAFKAAGLGGGAGGGEVVASDEFAAYEKASNTYKQLIAQIKEKLAIQEKEAAQDKEIARAAGDLQGEAEAEKRSADAKSDAVQKENQLKAAMVARFPFAAEKYKQDAAAAIEADTEKIKAENQLTEKTAAEEVKRLEAHKKLLEQQEAADLKSAERQAKIQSQTADQLRAIQLGIVSSYQAQLNQIMDAEAAAAANVKALRERVAEERTALEQKEANERIAINEKADQQIEADAKRIDDKIASDFNSIFDAILSRQKGGVTQALDAVLKKEFESMVGNIFKSGVESSGIGQSLSGTLLGKLFGGAEGSIFSGLFGGGGAGTTTAANGDQDFSSGVGNTLAGAGLNFGIGQIFKGLFGGLLGLFSQGGIVPTAAGGWQLPSFSGTMLAGLHSNEMVLPANISQGLQTAIAGGGIGSGGHVFNISAVDASSVAKLFMSNGSALVSALNSAVRNGSSLRTSGFANG